jgi:hypothetical protein
MSRPRRWAGACARAHRSTPARAQPPGSKTTKQPADHCLHGQPRSPEPEDPRGYWLRIAKAWLRLIPSYARTGEAHSKARRSRSGGRSSRPLASSRSEYATTVSMARAVLWTVRFWHIASVRPMHQFGRNRRHSGHPAAHCGASDDAMTHNRPRPNHAPTVPSHRSERVSSDPSTVLNRF